MDPRPSWSDDLVYLTMTSQSSTWHLHQNVVFRCWVQASRRSSGVYRVAHWSLIRPGQFSCPNMRIDKRLLIQLALCLDFACTSEGSFSKVCPLSEICGCMYHVTECLPVRRTACEGLAFVGLDQNRQFPLRLASLYLITQASIWQRCLPMIG